MTFENIVSKGEIAHDELSFKEVFQVFVTMFLNLSAADFLYVGKG